jgi:hypothetical protein
MSLYECRLRVSEGKWRLAEIEHDAYLVMGEVVKWMLHLLLSNALDACVHSLHDGFHTRK